MNREECPNGCDLATFGTHQGAPGCDLTPSDPDAFLTTALLVVDGRRENVDVAISSAQLRSIVGGQK